MNNYIDSETIVGIATALNNAGISIIRISGDEALNIIYKIFKPKNNNKDIRVVPSHTIHYGYIEYDDKVIDEVLVSIMKGPKSYTAEDVIEINCHGGIVVTKKILDICVINGARVANPGEFTKRAYLNGRIDLSQAEAVCDLINSKNEYALQSSVSQLSGALRNEIMDIREIILKDTAFIEAALDDPEHFEMEEYLDTLINNVSDVNERICKLHSSSENGRIIKEGINTVIIGKPNAGKSSFLNSLLGEERAIVTDIEGTTRDIITEQVNIDGIILNLIDTAGIRRTDDLVEKIGVDKAIEYIDKSDLVIYIVDASLSLDENDIEIMKLIKDKNVIVLLNKSDLETVVNPDKINKTLDCDIVEISAKENTGIDEFKSIILNKFYEGNVSYNDELYITNMRHKEALYNALVSIENVLESLSLGMPEDLLLVDMMNAYASLGLIIGEEVEDDLVDKIFKEFCMGK